MIELGWGLGLARLFDLIWGFGDLGDWIGV